MSRMRSAWTGPALLVALAVSMIVLAPARAAALQARLTDDAYTSSASPGANFGASGSVSVQGPPPTAAMQRAYLKFDLVGVVPAGTRGIDVTKATLRLWVKDVARPGMFDVYRVVGAWSEESLKDNAAPVLGALEVGSVPVWAADKLGFIQVDVTSVVRDWLNGVIPSNGLVLVPTATGIGVSFSSKETTAGGYEPQLQLALAGPPGPAGAMGPQGPTGPAGVGVSAHLPRVGGKSHFPADCRPWSALGSRLFSLGARSGPETCLAICLEPGLAATAA